MIRKVMIEVDENDLDDFIERGIVRADAARNATLIYESDDCINRQSVHDYISKNEYGAWVELPESTMHKDIDKLPSVIPKWNKWTRVEDGLPETHEDRFYRKRSDEVMCKIKDGEDVINSCGYLIEHVDGHKEWHTDCYMIVGVEVIAWMSIPEL